MIGLVILIAAAAMQAASHNIATFILARFFVGFGMDVASVPAPVLITEIAYPTHRGLATSLFQTCFFIGAIASSWITFGTFNMTDSTWSWRIPSALQAFFPVLQLIGIFFVPESPRWLIAKGRNEEARNFIVKYFAGGDENNPIVEAEYQEISVRIQSEQDAAGLGWSAVSFSRYSPGLSISDLNSSGKQGLIASDWPSLLSRHLYHSGLVMASSPIISPLSSIQSASKTLLQRHSSTVSCKSSIGLLPSLGLF
jgi:MFS family permease